MAILLLLLTALAVAINGQESCIFEKVALNTFSDRFWKQPVAVQSFGCDGLHQAVSILARDQTLPPFYKGCFKTLTQLVQLSLTNNGIGKVVPGTFDGLDVIEYINLNENKITEIQYGVFNGLPVVEIFLADNLISEIDSRAFSDLPKLVTLNLANNKIARWDVNWFTNAPLLNNVILSYNLIDQLPSAAFRPFLPGKFVENHQEPTVAGLNFNKHVVPNDFNYVDYHKVPFNVFNNPEDWTYYNKFPVVSSQSPVPSHQHQRHHNRHHQGVSIFLDHNNIHDISPEAFVGLDYLYKLDVEGNRLRSVDHVFPHTLHVAFLNLRNNLLTCLPETINANTVLHEGNPLRHECFKNYHKLESDYYHY